MALLSLLICCCPSYFPVALIPALLGEDADHLPSLTSNEYVVLFSFLENVNNMYPHVLGTEHFSHPELPDCNQPLLVLNKQNTQQRRKEHRETPTFPVLSTAVDI